MKTITDKSLSVLLSGLQRVEWGEDCFSMSSENGNHCLYLYGEKVNDYDTCIEQFLVRNGTDWEDVECTGEQMELIETTFQNHIKEWQRNLYSDWEREEMADRLREELTDHQIDSEIERKYF